MGGVELLLWLMLVGRSQMYRVSALGDYGGVLPFSSACGSCLPDLSACLPLHDYCFHCAATWR